MIDGKLRKTAEERKKDRNERKIETKRNEKNQPSKQKKEN